jgi:hypothetical protein
MSRPIRALAERHKTIDILERLLVAEVDSQLEQCWHNASVHPDLTEIVRLRALIEIADEANSLQRCWVSQGESEQ